MLPSCARTVCIVLPFLTVACSGAPEVTEAFDGQTQAYVRGAASDHDEHELTAEGEGEEPALAEQAAGLSLDPSDPVSTAVTRACTTTAVWGLATQLVQEIECMKPGSMARIDEVPGLELGGAVFPFLQTAAAKALIDTQQTRGKTMSINSGLRTLPQQFLLYRWYQTGRCGIGLAAKPGTSNHESGIAVDINDHAGWKAAMARQKYTWLGSGDPVHFDYTGSGAVDMSGLSVRAFQRLWNRNHLLDRIAEDGDYGPGTEKRLAMAPVGGFALGAICLPVR